MINRFTEVLSTGKTLPDLLVNMDREKLDPIIALDKRFRFTVEFLNRKLL